jgi:hypothetical protein
LRYNLFDHAASELAAAQRIEPHNRVMVRLNRRLALARDRANHAPAELATAHLQPPEIGRAPQAARTDELPAGAVELFTRRVQPVLVNSCTTAGCHQPGGEQQFQLDRSLLHGMANRRSTTRNLAATLELVNRQQPQLSLLLTVPREAHGGMDRPIFGPRQDAALRHLVDWVAMITTTSPPPDDELPADAVRPAAAEQVIPATPTGISAPPP